MNKKVWLSPPHMGGGEQKYIQEAFDTNWIAPVGINITEFERGIEKYLKGKKKVVALSSGTAAIHLALVLLKVQQGDEVLCQSFTFSATANSITYVGATPVFIDSESETWNMCPVLLEKAINERMEAGKKPKAIIAVHLYGMPYNVEKIKAIGKKYEIPIIEDAASALGSMVNKQQCGTFGDYGILSFNGNKIITTSGGGALICKDDKTKDKAIFLATQARDEAPHYQHSHIGYNYRMSNVLAGIGRGQLEVLEERVKARRRIFNFYKKTLKHTRFQFLEEPVGYTSNRWLTCVLTDSYSIREKIRVSLSHQNIECRPLWKPMHLQPVFKNCLSYKNGISEELFEKGLCLPSGSNITEEELNRIVGVLKDF
ncbi:pyridoxal phosphate-dependent aminotransferase [Lutibacter profundi]|uniref:Pyridoxal phosphate-dependent aminotransferase n=1 Tax=Lutibacter profundi TaxID=1622118 RepID=A0A109RNS2_9FLAO|nr:aminotransferase class I/II-fold pyridoxal phosphate-dependent enzyme [Lutibacter profundi]AMC10852.1 pyridoxal phosphate-dependent aminotransferase [Lutibacter profundi]